MANLFTHNGTFTVTSTATGEHRTFKVRTQKDDAKFAPKSRIVSLMTGPCNQSDYTGFAFVNNGKIHVWGSKQGGKFDAYANMLANLDRHVQTGKVTVEASICCRRCSRPLTTPESLASGIGPICEGRE